jgi:ribosomal protein S18 acetylase RimI-like enzyme
MPFQIRRKEVRDGEFLARHWTDRYGGVTIVARRVEYEPLGLEGFVCADGAEMLGALTYIFAGGELEVVTLDSYDENKGVGTALLDAAVDLARVLVARRAWLITSNDNIRALRFYQRRGWNMVALHRGAIEAARRIKPQIPLLGDDDIPIRHEIEFERLL